MVKKLLSLTLVFASLVSGAAYGVEWAEWNFSSDFDINDEIVAESSSDADSLMRLSAGTSAFSISGGVLTCTQTGPGDYLRLDIDDLQLNGGGSYVNEYTLIFDIRIDVPDLLPLYNTGYNNYNAADLWVRSDGAVGYGGAYTAPGVVPQSTWTRLVVKRYLNGGTWYRSIFADGILKRGGMDPEGVDGNLSLYTNGQQPDGQFTILSDSDATVYGGCKLGNFAFISEAMSDANIAALGGYDPNGIDLGFGEEPNTSFAEVKAGPYVHFTKKAEVTVYWKTETELPSILEYGVDPNLGQTVEDLTPKTAHELTITGIKPETNYSYRIDVNGVPTETYEFYSAFDFGPEPFPGGASPYPPDSLTSLYEQAAEHIINTSGVTRGVCIDYGCGRGRLAYEIAKRSDLKIIGFEEDASKVAEARNYLDDAGIYGVRATVLTGSLSTLNCRNYSANLIVCDKMIAEGTCPGASAEVLRLLRPDGGTAFLGQPPSCPNSLSRITLESWLSGLSYNITEDSNGLWANVTRGAIAGAGEWTHFYADLANTANSGETNIQNSMRVLWYGQPGPRYITDRHNRPMSSLYKNGIVVTPGIHRIMAFDAYNGSRYWDMAIPDATRVVVLRDSGWVALASDYAYVAHKQNCVGLDLKTGHPTIHLEAPQLIEAEKRNWGYLGVEDNRIYGSGQKNGASLIGHSLDHVYEAYYDNKPIATSDYLFCLNRYTGTQLWTYKRTGGSAIINPAITVGGDYIYFIESRNPTAINDADGRLTASVLMSGNNEYLVKLNKTTGAQAAAQQINWPFEHVVYLLYAADVNLVVVVGSRNNPGCRYEHYAYNPGNLSLVWSSNYNQGSTNGGHGEQDQHPVIVGSMMYSRYYKVNLSNGGVTAFPLSRGNCGTQSACATHLLGRNGNPYIYALPAGTPVQMTNETRPGCWINMIPAGGLLLIPESSAGCTCDYPIQTSMAFMPQ
jgi:SAM-dependent methyltransferase